MGFVDIYDLTHAFPLPIQAHGTIVGSPSLIISLESSMKTKSIRVLLFVISLMVFKLDVDV